MRRDEKIMTVIYIFYITSTNPQTVYSNAINISNGIISFILVDMFIWKHVEMRESSNDKSKDLNIHLMILLVNRKKNQQQQPAP